MIPPFPAPAYLVQPRTGVCDRTDIPGPFPFQDSDSTSRDFPQLELFSPYDEDDLSFGEWMESLPLDPTEYRKR